MFSLKIHDYAYLPYTCSPTCIVALTHFVAGYNDEQVVKLNELKNSEGEKAIEEQIAKAEQEYEEDEDYDDEDEDQVGVPREWIMTYFYELN